MNKYPIISVRVTRNLKFRATVQENKDSRKYEVTVGGIQWKLGKGRKHTDVILWKIRNILVTLQRNYDLENLPEFKGII